MATPVTNAEQGLVLTSFKLFILSKIHKKTNQKPTCDRCKTRSTNEIIHIVIKENKNTVGLNTVKSLVVILKILMGDFLITITSGYSTNGKTKSKYSNFNGLV